MSLLAWAAVIWLSMGLVSLLCWGLTRACDNYAQLFEPEPEVRDFSLAEYQRRKDTNGSA